MPDTATPAQPTASETPFDAVRVYAEDLTKIVCVAQALAAADRQIDLTGLDSQIGLLCAKSLDLPPEEGRTVRPHLIALFGSVEELARTLAMRAPPPH